MADTSPITDSEESDEIIRRNLDFLTKSTTDWPTLKINLRQRNLLSESDIQILDGKNYPDDASKFYEMYRRVSRKGNIDKLIECLRRSNNKDVADVLIQAQLVNFRNKMESEEIYLRDMKRLMALAETNTVFRETVTEDLRFEKSFITENMSRAERKKQMFEIQIQDLNKKLSDAILAETKAQAKLKMANEIDKSRLMQVIVELNIEKSKHQEELQTRSTLLEGQNTKLKELEEKLRQNAARLMDLVNEKYELQQRISEMNENHELERKSHDTLMSNVKLDYVSKIQDLKEEIRRLESQRNLQLVLVDDNALVNSKIWHLRESIKNLSEDCIVKRKSLATHFEESIYKPELNENIAVKLDFNAAGENYLLTGSKDMSEEFQPPQFNLEKKTSIVIRSCQIQPKTLLKILRPCNQLKSIQLLDVIFLEKFKDVLPLPRLETFALSLRGSEWIAKNGFHTCIFWKQISDLGIQNLVRLNVDIDIMHNGVRILRLNRKTGEFIGKPIQFECNLQGSTFTLRSLGLWASQINVHSFPVNLTQLNLTRCGLKSSDLLVLLQKQTSLKKFQYLCDKSKRNDLDFGCLPTSLVEVSIESVDIVGIGKQNTGTSNSVPSFQNLRKLCLINCAVSQSFIDTFPKTFSRITHLLAQNLRKMLYSVPFQDFHSRHLENWDLYCIFQSLTLEWICMEHIRCTFEPDPFSHLNLLFHGYKENEFISVLLRRQDCKWVCTERSRASSIISKNAFEMIGLNNYYSSYRRYVEDLG